MAHLKIYFIMFTHSHK